MDEILHGDNSDRKLEELEESMRKISDMQKHGADIYFGGFSKMKRFGFFYTPANWFTPFYIQHPGLEQIPETIQEAKFMTSLLSSMPFCDSDKYSFALAMSTVYAQLPDNIKEMLGNNVAMEVSEPKASSTRRPSIAANIFKIYTVFSASTTAAGLSEIHSATRTISSF